MQQLLYVLPVLVCPIVMGLVMWFMMRGMGRGKDQKPTPEQEQELAKLRAEVNALRPGTGSFDERHPAPVAEATKPA
jgi:hypothetical protein